MLWKQRSAYVFEGMSPECINNSERNLKMEPHLWTLAGASKLLCPRGSITNVSTTPINLKTEPHLWTLALQELQTLQGLDLGRIEL
jgi:hypothetical protein